MEFEFVARSPEIRDLDEVIKVLGQSFRGSEDVNLELLALFVLNQGMKRYFGSVLTIKEHVDTNGKVLSLSTIIPLKETRVSGMLVRHMSNIAGLYRGGIRVSQDPNIAATDGRQKLLDLLSSSDSNVGLIISERTEKFPPRIAEPIYQDLANDVKKAQNKNLPFNFTHYAIISKVMVPSDPEMAQMMGSMGVTYSNEEEELFGPECDFMVDTKMSDEESKSQGDLIEKKKIMVFKAEKLDKIVNIVKNAFPIS